MPLKIHCPEGHQLMVPMQRAGTYVRCPICMQTVKIPEEQPTPSEAKPRTSARSTQVDSTRKSEPQNETSAAKKRPEQTKESAARPSESVGKVRKTKEPSKPNKIASDESQKARTKKDNAVARKDESREAKQERKKHRDTPQKKSVIAPDKVASEPKNKSERTQVSREAKKEPKAKSRSSSSIEREKKSHQADKKNNLASAPAVERSAPVSEPTPPPPGPSTPSEAAYDAHVGEPSSDSLVRGVEHDLSKRWTAYYLGISLAVVGLLNLSPAVFEIVDYYNPENLQSLPIPRWAYAALCVGTIQIVYAVYLAQLPDWSSVWVVAVLTLMIASAYAMLLGIVWLGDGEGRIVTLLELTSDIRKKATLWCFSMMSVTSCLTYFCGREGVRWHKIHSVQANVPGTA